MTKVLALLVVLLPVSVLRADPADIRNGRSQCEQHCGLCHGIKRRRRTGPQLAYTDSLPGDSATQAYESNHKRFDAELATFKRLVEGR